MVIAVVTGYFWLWFADSSKGGVERYEYSVAVLLVTFCELSGVPFLVCACSQECQEVIAKKFGERNIELQKQLDLDYKEMIKEAVAYANNNEVDISSNVPEAEISAFTPYGYFRASNFQPPGRHRRRHRKKCTIMWFVTVHWCIDSKISYTGIRMVEDSNLNKSCTSQYVSCVHFGGLSAYLFAIVKLPQSYTEQWARCACIWCIHCTDKCIMQSSVGHYDHIW